MLNTPSFRFLTLLALLTSAPLPVLLAETPEPVAPAAPASPKEELARVEARIKEIAKEVDAHPELIPLKTALDEAEKKFKAASKEADGRLDPENKIDALRKEVKTAAPERQAQIQASIRDHEKSLAADPALAPLAIERVAARKAYAEKRKALVRQVAQDFPELEKRRKELRQAGK